MALARRGLSALLKHVALLRPQLFERWITLSPNRTHHYPSKRILSWFVFVTTYPLDSDLSREYSVIQPSNNWDQLLMMWRPAKLSQHVNATYCNTVACSMLHIKLTMSYAVSCNTLYQDDQTCAIRYAKMLCLFDRVIRAKRFPYLTLICRSLTRMCIFHRQTNQESLLIFHQGRKQGPFVLSYITAHTAGSHSFCSDT